MLGWSLVVGAVWCGAFAALYELAWFRRSRTMANVVLRHVRRDGTYTVTVKDKKRLWNPAGEPDRSRISGPGEATYSQSGDEVVLELVRPGDEGESERFEGPPPDLSASGTRDKPALGRLLRSLRMYVLGLELVPPVGWLVGALVSHGSGLEVLLGWIGWAVANFLTIGAFWMTMGGGARRRLRHAQT